MVPSVIERVDPFIGTDVTSLPPPDGLAATWWWPKPQVGNTHPGATYPLGMVSACAYSGAYPTGYGRYPINTEGIPLPMYDDLVASGFSHFQQSGTGAIRKYYNYFRVTPMMLPLDELGRTWKIVEEAAEPGYYACTLDSGIRCELTVGPKSAVHRYTFPEHQNARIVIDCSIGGLTIEHGTTVPLRASLHQVSPTAAEVELTVEGTPLSAYVECGTPEWRQMLWYDRRLMPGGSRLDFDHIRPTTLRTFGLMWVGDAEAGQTVELRFGFSLRGVEQAATNLRADLGREGFTARRRATSTAWARHLDRIKVETDSADRETVFATAMYHSFIKPCFASGESPWWPADGPFVFDVCTMWDIYRTQLPLLTTLFPLRASELANSLLTICEEEGNLPIGYRMARGGDRFARQGSALAHTFLADLCQLGFTSIDWDWALVHMHTDLRRGYAEEMIERGIVHPITHQLDVAFGYQCTAVIARHLGDEALARQFEAIADGWRAAYDPMTGLLVDSTFYEGGKWNYSFRLMHDMASRIDLAGGEAHFTTMLDAFFGFGAEPVKQLGEHPTPEELTAGYALNRFEGLNNEPDMEAPWAYHYTGRPDRTAEVVHAIVTNQYGTGRGGLPGNDDSGGLSSWYVWASLGLFPVAGQNLYLLNAPSFRSSTIETPGGPLSIDTTGFAEPTPGGPAQYVQSVTLDGQPLDRTWITGNELHAGGHLVFTLGDEPSQWGTSTRPPGAAQHAVLP